MTKNGLPPESACSSDGSCPARSASSATASADSAGGSIRRTQLSGSVPSTRRTSGSASLRLVRIRQPGRAHEAPPEQRHEVERGVVGPVQVLDDQHGGAGERVQRRAQHVLARAVAVERLQHRAAEGPGDVAQRAERARRDQRVARAPEHAPLVQRLGDRGHERRLADPRLADHGHDATGVAGLRQRRLEDFTLAFTLKQLQSLRSLTARR